MRGKRFGHMPVYCTRGITPAHAGKTSRVKWYIDLPRGSPPRMRGKLAHSSGMPDSDRITPAHAGKTCTLVQRLGLHRDHPRACGENPGQGHGLHRVLGSPPRMRGKRRCRPCLVRRGGITPAHAGKTIKLHYNVYRLQDHPRACGENGRRKNPE